MYLFLIDEETEIKEGDYYLDGDNNLFTPQHNFFAIKSFNKVIGYFPLNSEAKELDLPLLPNPFEVKPTEQIVAEFCRNSENIDYNKIQDKVHLAFLQEDMVLLYEQSQSKQFSLEDMKKAIEMARVGFKEYPNNSFKAISNYIKDETNRIIQSLSTQQLPKEFVISDKSNTFEENIKNGEYKW